MKDSKLLQRLHLQYYLTKGDYIHNLMYYKIIMSILQIVILSQHNYLNRLQEW